jgi:uncharacterized protein
MEMAGERQIAAPPQRVWEALNDPAVLSQCIPGCKSLEKEADDRFNATAEVKIGPIGARFKGAVVLTDIDAPNGYTITGTGNGGVAGNAKGQAKVQLRGEGGGTLLSYQVDAQVGGRMAQLGGPLIDATAKNMADKFFTKFGEVVGGGGAAAEAPVPAVAATSLAAAVPVAVAQPSTVPSTGFPTSWAVALALAIVAGFVLGRSLAADWWIVAVVILALAAAKAGYDSGRRSGGQS